MKKIYQSIKEHLVYERLNSIDNEIICESIKSTIIKDLAKQLLDQINNEKKKNKEDNTDWRSICNKNFKKIFGDSRIPWDKIDDNDIQTIDAQTWDDKKLKNTNEKFIRSVVKGDNNSIVIGQDPETKVFEYVIMHYSGTLYYLSPKYNHSVGDQAGNGFGRHYKDLTQREKINLFNGKTLYIIDSKFKDSVDKLRNDRFISRQGMINLDPYSLSRIAQENVERYKKIMSQNKAKNQNNDKLLDEANEIIKKISDISVQVAKDPLSYADVLYKVETLTKYIYDVRTYHAPRTSRDKGYYSGYNGLIPMIAKYIEAVNDSKKGYSWGSKDIDTYISNIKDSISKCKKLIEEVEDLL